MEKLKSFVRTIFDSKFISEAISAFLETSSANSLDKCTKILSVSLEHETWNHDTLEEFIADYSKNPRDFHIILKFSGYQMSISFASYSLSTIISIMAPNRKEIETLFNRFEQSADKFYIPEPEKPQEEEEVELNAPNIFIGHGKSKQWRDLKDHLQDKHEYNVIAYETGARAGHSIRDILESMLDDSSFAILVFTSEDKAADGTMHARENVIHEAGLFQGRLGFNRAIILLERGTEEFSNIHGIQQIRYSKGKIKETFGDILATIKREFE